MYSTQKALSDLSFADCKCHKGVEEQLVYEVRDWLAENMNLEIPSASSLWDDYNSFYADMYKEKINSGFKQNEINRLPIAEYMKYIDNYLG